MVVAISCKGKADQVWAAKKQRNTKEIQKVNMYI